MRVYEAVSTGVRLLGRRQVDPYCAGPTACADEESRLECVLQALQDCDVLLCAKIGIAPWRRLEAAGVQPNSEHALEPIEPAILAVYREWRAAGRRVATAQQLRG